MRVRVRFRLDPALSKNVIFFSLLTDCKKNIFNILFLVGCKNATYLYITCLVSRFFCFRFLLCFLFLWYSKRVKIGVTHDPDFRCRPRSGLRSGVAHDPDYRSHPRSGLCTGVAHDPDYSTSVAHDPDYRCHPRSGLQASPSTRAIYSSELGFFLLTPFLRVI